MKYPKYTDYEQLYKRYFARSSSELIALANVTKIDRTLDLCGGNGRLSKQLTTFSNDVTYLDQEVDMIPEDLPSFGIKVINMSVENFVKTNKQKYDKVFCQQAINYWLNDVNVKEFSEIFSKGGIFVFNTFQKKPSKAPSIKQYDIDGHKYIEVSYSVKNKIFHVQATENLPPHFTIFDWISHRKYLKLLTPYFSVTRFGDGKTSIYVCKKI